MIQRTQRATLFPYTTLFRSGRALRDAGVDWSKVGSLYAGSLEVANPEAITGLVGMTGIPARARSEEHTSELQSQSNLVCRLLLEKKKSKTHTTNITKIVTQS